MDPMDPISSILGIYDKKNSISFWDIDLFNKQTFIIEPSRDPCIYFFLDCD